MIKKDAVRRRILERVGGKVRGGDLLDADAARTLDVRSVSPRISAPSSSTFCLVVCFFSSRRRHTRCSRDWSSDVCSSDLVVQTLGAIGQPYADIAPNQ